MAFEGIFIEQPQGPRSLVFPVGFKGIALEYPSGLRFIRVTDFRGIPISGCLVTVQNTSGDYSAITDSLGIAAVEIDVSGTKTILLLKNKTRSSFSYTFSSESITKTVILQPRLL